MVYYIFEGKTFKYKELFTWTGESLVWFIGNPDFTSGSNNDDNSDTNGGSNNGSGNGNTPNSGNQQPGTGQPNGSNNGTQQPDGNTPNGGTSNGSGNGSTTQTPNDTSDNPIKFNRPKNSVVNGIPTDSEGKYDFSSFYPDLKKMDKKNMATHGSIAINPEKPENNALLYGVDNDYDGGGRVFKNDY